MRGHDIVVVGASAGGVEALRVFVSGLPADLAAAVFVVLHLPANARSVLPDILNRAGSLHAKHAEDGEAIERGTIYVAQPGFHLLVRPGVVRQGRGPYENLHRPSVDVLFRSAARAYGNRVVGVVLSGTLDDGTAGLLTIKRHGGVAAIQDPADALFSDMPRSAIEHVSVDYVAPVADLGPLVARVTLEPSDDVDRVANLSVSASPNGRSTTEHMQQDADDLDIEDRVAEFDEVDLLEDGRPGKPSTFGCPDCGGTLWEIDDGELVRWRCRVGHAYSAESLLGEMSESLEDALWVALRAIEERASLTHRLATQMASRGHHASAARFQQQTQDARQRARVIRSVLALGANRDEEQNPRTQSQSA